MDWGLTSRADTDFGIDPRIGPNEIGAGPMIGCEHYLGQSPVLGLAQCGPNIKVSRFTNFKSMSCLPFNNAETPDPTVIRHLDDSSCTINDAKFLHPQDFVKFKYVRPQLDHVVVQS
ncbi:hypothetical protein AMTRI_Chr06g191830 [Amborella trichopoda]